ncbi:MAG: MarR family transcriptional regulator [Polyangiaceae bacterium]
MVDNRLLPIDLLVVMKLVTHEGESTSVRHLEDELGLSKSAAANSLQRLRELGLVKDGPSHGRRVNKLLLRDCLEHAARWIAPARVGDFELGLPTAHAAESFKQKLTGDEDPVVMPLPHGPLRGRAVTPLHPLAPAAAAKDPKLHRLLAVVDAFRIGRARDRQVAVAELRKCL